MKRGPWVVLVTTWILAIPIIAWPRHAAAPADSPGSKTGGGPRGVFVLDGSTVHNVGELQMHIGNWGLFGSLPGVGQTYSEAPSAQWPAGSGTEYLFGAGLWVGALKNGVPAVSTTVGFTQSGIVFEFDPGRDTRDVMYRSAEGRIGGVRAPSSGADDDGDGAVDEDWLNGYDDDGDGLIDEDFAAISNQMMVCRYADYYPETVRLFPQHNPLGLEIRQESYQWEEDIYDDFVGMQFTITNAGTNVLEDVYVGFFADGDAGQRGSDRYWEDDATGRRLIESYCTELGPVAMDIAFTFDADGDEGRTPGYLGLMFLGHTVDPTGQSAPRRVGISTYSNFSGSASFEEGGDPTNDFERYELLSSRTIKRDALVPRDYRMMMAAGPFKELLPGSTLVFQTAFVNGNRLNGMIDNAARAQLTFEGAWFDQDNDRTTGVDGRETPVHGPADAVSVDTCRYAARPPVSVPRGQTLWINNDCAREEAFRSGCRYDANSADTLKFMTGINGQETHIFWLVGTAPPPPNMRIDRAARDGVAIYWDNSSETRPDVKTLEYDFEGYRIFRADNWTRPIGTSTRTGPPANLWKMLVEADNINGVGLDTGLERYRYEPLTHLLSPPVRREMIDGIKLWLTEYPGTTPPCPQGVTPAVCDTLGALAAWELGLPESGRQYYRFIDRSIHRGVPYFFAVTATDHAEDSDGRLRPGKVGDPASNFTYVEALGPPQAAYAYRDEAVFVVPNPVTRQSLQPWALGPNNDDPTGVKVEFRNLPADRGTIRVFTLAGDLVREIPFDGRTGIGTAEWDLVSRNGQDVTSGVYLYSVETDFNAAFARKIGKFVVIR
ncbi:MAG TPA: hypothetical protein VFX92_09950 [Candidatus Krumholzibacteria bacterium]|nr:hypothetical protein [Candidatus Krumholzibacteria bacterium]